MGMWIRQFRSGRYNITVYNQGCDLYGWLGELTLDQGSYMKKGQHTGPRGGGTCQRSHLNTETKRVLHTNQPFAKDAGGVCAGWVDATLRLDTDIGFCCSLSDCAIVARLAKLSM